MNRFWSNIPEDCKKAISELKRLKVHNLAAYDNEENFSDVWYLILIEVDKWDWGECRAEADAQDSNPCYLTRTNANAARKWLVKWEYLFIKYADRGQIGNPEQISFQRNPA